MMLPLSVYRPTSRFSIAIVSDQFSISSITSSCSVICWDFDFVDARDSCENGTYVFVTRAIPFGRPELKRHRTTSPTNQVG